MYKLDRKNKVEIFKEKTTGNLYLKNKKGRVFLVNRDSEFAEKNKLNIIYTTSSGRVIIRPKVSDRRRISRKIKAERDKKSLLVWYKASTLLWAIRREYRGKEK